MTQGEITHYSVRYVHPTTGVGYEGILPLGARNKNQACYHTLFGIFHQQIPTLHTSWHETSEAHFWVYLNCQPRETVSEPDTRTWYNQTQPYHGISHNTAQTRFRGPKNIYTLITTGGAPPKTARTHTRTQKCNPPHYDERTDRHQYLSRKTPRKTPTHPRSSVFRKLLQKQEQYATTQQGKKSRTQQEHAQAAPTSYIPRAVKSISQDGTNNGARSATTKRRIGSRP